MFELSKSEIAVFRAVARGCNYINEIAKESGLSISRTSQLISTLTEKGFLFKKRKGISKEINLSDTKISDYLRRLVFSPIDIDNIIVSSKINILFSILSTEKKLDRISRETNLSKETLRKYTRMLRKLGIVYSKNKKIGLSSSLPLLLDFLKEYASYINRRIVSNISPNGTVIWEQSSEFIFRIPGKEEVKKGLVTAITALSHHGIDIISDNKYYYHAPWIKKLRPEDIALHVILLDSSSIRMLSYAMLFLRRIDEYDDKYLISKGKEYKIDMLVKDMLKYLRGKEIEKPPFPSRVEFDTLCVQYGVG